MNYVTFVADTGEGTGFYEHRSEFLVFQTRLGCIARQLEAQAQIASGESYRRRLLPKSLQSVKPLAI